MPDLIETSLNDLKKLLAPIVQATKVDLKAPDSVEKLRRLLEKFPDPSAYEDAKNVLQDSIAKLASSHMTHFRKALTGFINDAKANGDSVREGDNAWRVGSIELQLKANDPEVRFLYNKEVVLDWQTAHSRKELDAVHEQAVKLLADAELSDRQAIFREALQRLVAFRKYKGELSAERVPINDFYKEVRSELLRKAMQTKGAARKPITSDFPLWMFLYNFDRHLREQNGNFHMFVETGSQADTSKGMALILNGLDARNDYKQYCFVKPGTQANG